MGIEFGEDEVDKRRRQLLDMYKQGRAIDPTSIRNADPGKRYKLVNKHPERVQMHEAQGFKVTPADDPAQLLMQTAKGSTAGGGQQYRDLILMEEPMDLYQAKREHAQARL